MKIVRRYNFCFQAVRKSKKSLKKCEFKLGLNGSGFTNVYGKCEADF